MNIDFTEIPAGNRGGKDQDTFELFACDFLESLGYEIVERPSRGPDGKKDLIVKSNSVLGNTSDSKIRWLVSCKHNAHSNKGISDVDEPDISDRLLKHKCHGFIGFYSTIPTSSLSDKLHTLKDRFVFTIYDCKRIEKEISGLKDKIRILATFFPKSREEWEIKNNKIEENQSIKKIEREALLEISRTALIQIEIVKIIYNFPFFLSKEDDLYGKIYSYIDFKNEIIAAQIFDFLNYSVSSTNQLNKNSSIASDVHGLVLAYFPSSYGEEDMELRLANGKECLSIGFNLAYDAFIYTKNYRNAQLGLNIWKFIYREAKRKEYTELIELVNEKYDELEDTLNRPERNDLKNAIELVKIFKEDLKNSSLTFPVLPEELYELVKKSDNIK